MEEKNKKPITLEDIAELIKTSASETTKALEAKIESSEEKLAAMTQKQFLEYDEKMDKRFKGLETEIKDIKSDTENIKANLNKKVDKTDHNTLKYRVEKLEKKFA